MRTNPMLESMSDDEKRELIATLKAKPNLAIPKLTLPKFAAVHKSILDELDFLVQLERDKASPKRPRSLSAIFKRRGSAELKAKDAAMPKKTADGAGAFMPLSAKATAPAPASVLTA